MMSYTFSLSPLTRTDKFLAQQSCLLAVGTPNRLSALIECGLVVFTGERKEKEGNARKTTHTFAVFRSAGLEEYRNRDF